MSALGASNVLLAEEEEVVLTEPPITNPPNNGANNPSMIAPTLKQPRGYQKKAVGSVGNKYVAKGTTPNHSIQSPIQAVSGTTEDTGIDVWGLEKNKFRAGPQIVNPPPIKHKKSGEEWPEEEEKESLMNYSGNIYPPRKNINPHGSPGVKIYKKIKKMESISVAPIMETIKPIEEIGAYSILDIEDKEGTSNPIQGGGSLPLPPLDIITGDDRLFPSLIASSSLSLTGDNLGTPTLVGDITTWGNQGGTQNIQDEPLTQYPLEHHEYF